MTWNIALGWHGFMSDEPRADGEPFQAWSCAVSAEELQPSDYQRWRDLRAHLQQCEETRRRQFRFRKDPASYLAALEAQLLM